MTDSTSDYAPRDIGTTIASSIAIVFISSIIYSSVFSEKHRIHSLKYSTWYEIDLTPAQQLNFHLLEFRTGDITLYLDYYRTQIYEQPCKGFKATCIALDNKSFELQGVTFYSNQALFNPSSHLVLKSIRFTDQDKKTQTLEINPQQPNHPDYISKQKDSFSGSMLMTFFVFSMFNLVFYFNHPGRALASFTTIKRMNKAIIVYYFATIAFVIIQYLLM